VPRHRLASRRPQRTDVIDAVPSREHRRNHRQRLAPDVGTCLALAQLEVLAEELLEPQVLHQRGRQHQPRITHHPGVIELNSEAVQAVRRCHLTGAPFLKRGVCRNSHCLSSKKRPFLRQVVSDWPFTPWIGAKPPSVIGR